MGLGPSPYYYRALNAQKGDDDVIGGPKEVSWDFFRNVTFGKIFDLEYILYFG